MSNGFISDKGVTIGFDNSGNAIGFEETVGTACKNPNGYTVGSYFKGTDGNFYEVTATISSGATITVGTNCKRTDIATELSELNADIAYTEIATANTNQTWATQISSLATAFGNLTTDQKRRSALVGSDSFIFRIIAIDGRFMATVGDANGVNTYCIRISSNTYVNSKINTDGTSQFFDQSSNTNAGTLKLVLLN